MSLNIATLILAGGNSSRFGGCKLLARYRGKALISYSLEAAKAISPGSAYLLTGAWHSALLEADEISGLLAGVSVLQHSNWQDGMGSSIAKGMQSIAGNYDAVLIMLADQPLVTLADYQALLAALEKVDVAQGQKAADICCAFYADKYGVPAVFKRTCFEALLKLSGDRGAQRLLYNDRYRKIALNLNSAKVDVDDPQTLEYLNLINQRDY